MQHCELSMVIPVFNGEARIGATLEAVTNYFAARRSYEIIVVDDGSRDRTASIIEESITRHPRVRLIRLPVNRGKGAAVRAGMLAASAGSRCFFDADLPMPLAQLETILDRLEHGAHVVMASRVLPDSRVVLQPDPPRRVMSAVFNRVVRALFRLPFRDTQCGLKGLSAEAAEAIFSRSRLDGFAFDVELLLLARQLGYAIEEVPVRWDNPAHSTVRILGHAPTILRDLWTLWASERQGVPHG